MTQIIGEKRVNTLIYIYFSNGQQLIIGVHESVELANKIAKKFLESENDLFTIEYTQGTGVMEDTEHLVMPRKAAYFMSVAAFSESRVQVVRPDQIPSSLRGRGASH